MNRAHKKEVLEILDGPRPRSTWTGADELRVYIRKSKRAWAGKLIDAIDIASVETALPGQGHWKQFITWVEQEAEKRGLAVFVESVLNQDLARGLLKHGYQDHSTPLCYIKTFENKADSAN